MASLADLMPKNSGTEEAPDTSLTARREPKRRLKSGAKGSVGDQAVMDAVCIVAFAWIVLILLALSLRNHNI